MPIQYTANQQRGSASPVWLRNPATLLKAFGTVPEKLKKIK